MRYRLPLAPKTRQKRMAGNSNLVPYFSVVGYIRMAGWLYPIISNFCPAESLKSGVREAKLCNAKAANPSPMANMTCTDGYLAPAKQCNVTSSLWDPYQPITQATYGTIEDHIGWWLSISLWISPAKRREDEWRPQVKICKHDQKWGCAEPELSLSTVHHR